jgi:hypothetical protein
MRSIYFTGLFILAFVLAGPAGLSQTRPLKPLYPEKKILVSESGHTGTYYLLSKESPSFLLVKGPGLLKVITRGVINPREKSAKYSVSCSVDGSDVLKKDYNSDISEKAFIKHGISGKPGTLKTFEIELGPGEHSLEFTSGRTVNPFIIRYLFKKTKSERIRWVMLSPMRPNEPVDLVTHENVVHYYRFSQKKPLKIRINGPTTMRVLTRFENHYDMKGRIDYRVQVKEDGKVIHTYLLSSVYSEVTNYKKNGRLVPGKAREFYIRVPSGRHNYTIVPLDKDKNTILARVLIPKKDVKLEE